MGNSKDASVAKLLESVLNQVLKAQVSEQVAADHYERTDDRQGYRNGTYPRSLTTRVGNIMLRSDLCSHLDPLVEAWNSRPLTSAFPFVLVDALFLKVREDNRVCSRGVMVAVGINTDIGKFWGS